jgi:hypothetical protein
MASEKPLAERLCGVEKVDIYLCRPQNEQQPPALEFIKQWLSSSSNAAATARCQNKAKQARERERSPSLLLPRALRNLLSLSQSSIPCSSSSSSRSRVCVQFACVAQYGKVLPDSCESNFWAAAVAYVKPNAARQQKQYTRSHNEPRRREEGRKAGGLMTKTAFELDWRNIWNCATDGEGERKRAANNFTLSAVEKL